MLQSYSRYPFDYKLTNMFQVIMFLLDLHFRGYAVRYLRPEVTSSWRVSFENKKNHQQQIVTNDLRVVKLFVFLPLDKE